MLDNFSPAGIAAAAGALKADYLASGAGPAAKRALVEVSGGLTYDSMEESLCPGKCGQRGAVFVVDRARAAC